MSIGIIIQARTGSTRLPGKVLKNFFQQQTILDIIIEKIKSIVPGSFKIIIATSVLSQDDAIESVAKKHGVNYFRGDEEDVLKRFIDAAEFFSLEKIIRVCADNPFIDTNGLKKLIADVTSGSDDYVAFQTQDGTPAIKTHFGLWAEGVKFSALKKVSEITDEKIFHEHVTNFIYTYPEKFSIRWLSVDDVLKGRNDIRFTIDTLSDFENMVSIYADLKSQKITETVPNLVQYIDVHPANREKMQHEILLNTK